MNQLSSFAGSAMLDPRLCNIVYDANALDHDGSPRDALVDRFHALTSTGKVDRTGRRPFRGHRLTLGETVVLPGITSDDATYWANVTSDARRLNELYARN